VNSLPTDVRDYLCARLVLARNPAMARVDGAGRIALVQGNWAAYGYDGLREGADAVGEIPPLEGVLPLRGDSLMLPMVATGSGRYADVHVFAGDGCTWVVLVDASELASDRMRLQQAMNETALLHEKEQRLLRQVREDQESLEAILDTMRVVIASLDGEGRVLYLSRWGCELLARRRREVTLRPWDRVFRLSDADTERLRDRLAGGGGGDRLAVRLSAAGGRTYWMEADVQPDPRDPPPLPRT
jgi:PAS domain S-box-containing protein